MNEKDGFFLLNFMLMILLMNTFSVTSCYYSGICLIYDHVELISFKCRSLFFLLKSMGIKLLKFE